MNDDDRASGAPLTSDAPTASGIGDEPAAGSAHLPETGATTVVREAGPPRRLPA
jgi:hypothetical protein